MCFPPKVPGPQKWAGRQIGYFPLLQSGLVALLEVCSWSAANWGRLLAASALRGRAGATDCLRAADRGSWPTARCLLPQVCRLLLATCCSQSFSVLSWPQTRRKWWPVGGRRNGAVQLCFALIMRQPGRCWSAAQASLRPKLVCGLGSSAAVAPSAKSSPEGRLQLGHAISVGLSGRRARAARDRSAQSGAAPQQVSVGGRPVGERVGVRPNRSCRSARPRTVSGRWAVQLGLFKSRAEQCKCAPLQSCSSASLRQCKNNKIVKHCSRAGRPCGQSAAHTALCTLHALCHWPQTVLHRVQ